MTTKERYIEIWSNKTKGELKKEIISWKRYFEKHGKAYGFHGGNMTPPNTLSDGDKISILKEILINKS
jgi:hypothetical protein